MRFFLLFLLFFSSLFATIKDYILLPSATKEQLECKYIKILDIKELDFSGVSEISGLAYKKNTLYAIGDSGYLYKFYIEIKNRKIATLKLKEKYALKDKHNKRLSKKYRDSEGLAFYKNKLLISFEDRHRVELFSLNAKEIKSVKINKKLTNYSSYNGKNKGLESVAYSKKYGVVTAPEVPLNNGKTHIIYAKHHIWKFKEHGVISDMVFMDKNRLLILLKEFSFFTRHRVSKLCMINLKKCKNRKCKPKILAKLDSKDGWRLDNFEGLTKVGKNLYLVVSDDNNNIFQKTILVLFELNLSKS